MRIGTPPSPVAVADVLEEATRLGDVEQLHAAADRQHRKSSLIAPVSAQSEFPRIASIVGFLRVVPRTSSPVERRIDIGSAPEHHANDAMRATQD